MTGEPAGITEGEASRPPLPAASARPSAHPLPGLEIIDMAMPLPPLPAALAADKEQGLGLYFGCELCVDFISESKYFHRPGRPGERIPDPRPGLGYRGKPASSDAQSAVSKNRQYQDDRRWMKSCRKNITNWTSESTC